MAILWLTYAWADNQNQDIDFCAQELTRAGLTVKLDRWNIEAGRRLWQQIENFITNPNESDAWALYATQNSLGSEPCKEEFAYALDRALRTRGGNYPVIGLFPSSVDSDLIPAAIRTRLFVSITDRDWKERIVSAAENRRPNISGSQIDPFHVAVHRDEGKFIIELRPRAGTWAPFRIAVEPAERHLIERIRFGPKDHIPQLSMMITLGEGLAENRTRYMWDFNNEATPTQSYYVVCTQLPKYLGFGKVRSDEFFEMRWRGDMDI